MASAPVVADPIAIANPSFEILPEAGLTNSCGVGCRWSEDFIPGWQNVPFAGLGLVSGQWQPGTHAGNTAYFDSLPDGITHAFTNAYAIVQPGVATVQPGVVYTLRVEVGNRKDGGPTGSPAILVRTPIANTLIFATGTPVLGGWATYTAAYLGRPEHAGLPIDVYLGASGVQGNFDAVRLDAPEPEMGSALVAGAAWIAFVAVRRRFAREEAAV